MTSGRTSADGNAGNSSLASYAGGPHKWQMWMGVARHAAYHHAVVKRDTIRPVVLGEEEEAGEEDLEAEEGERRCEQVLHVVDDCMTIGHTVVHRATAQVDDLGRKYSVEPRTKAGKEWVSHEGHERGQPWEDQYDTKQDVCDQGEAVRGAKKGPIAL